MTVNRTLFIMNVIIVLLELEVKVIMASCASLTVHVIATNPLSCASLSPSGSKLVNALREEALKCQETWFVVKISWFWKGVQVLYLSDDMMLQVVVQVLFSSPT